MIGILSVSLLVVSLTLGQAFIDDSVATAEEDRCTNVLVGKNATVDGSTIGSYACCQ